MPQGGKYMFFFYPPFPFADEWEENECVEAPQETPVEEWLIISLLRGFVSFAFLSCYALMLDRGKSE